MKTFLDKDFLLNTEAAKKLYHEAAEKQPIIDYHCHLNPKEIYEDVRYENITQVWLGGDHYKWRLMRSAGIPEKYITGDAGDREKFEKYAEVLGKVKNAHFPGSEGNEYAYSRRIAENLEGIGKLAEYFYIGLRRGVDCLAEMPFYGLIHNIIISVSAPG